MLTCFLTVKIPAMTMNAPIEMSAIQTGFLNANEESIMSFCFARLKMKSW
jgi:hypothetical protein